MNENYWDLTFQGVLGKLYVISLFVTLYVSPPIRTTRLGDLVLIHNTPRNGRQDLQSAPVNGVSTNRISNIAWTSPIRVDVSPRAVLYVTLLSCRAQPRCPSHVQISTDLERGGNSHGSGPTDDRRAIDTPIEAAQNGRVHVGASMSEKPP